MSHNLDSLKWVIYGTNIGVFKRDTRSLDSGSHGTVYSRRAKRSPSNGFLSVSSGVPPLSG